MIWVSLENGRNFDLSGAQSLDTKDRGEDARVPLIRRRISSVVRALDVFADPWTYLILREAFFGVRRFDELKRNLQISRTSLVERLNHLVVEGILKRRKYQDRPERFEYRLTAAGRDFYPAILGLMSWGDRWCKTHNGPPLTLTHRCCNKRLEPIVVCSHCHKPLVAFEVVVSDGPGAGLEDLPKVRETRRRGGDEGYIRGRPCSVARTLQKIGDRWSFRILRESFLGVRRFEELLANTGAARNILTARLNALVEHGILKRKPYSTHSLRNEYVLTDSGLDLYPSLLLFMAWGDRWRRAANGPPLILRHAEPHSTKCQKPIKPLLICRSCHGPVDWRDVKFKMNYQI